MVGSIIHSTGVDYLNPKIPLRGLLSIILRSHRVFISRELEDMNLTDAQVACILRVNHRPGFTQDELAWFFQVDKGTIARTIRRLEDRGFLNRKQDPDNRRRYMLSLTEKGRQAIPIIMDAERKWAELLFRNMTMEEQEAFIRMCQRLAEEAMEIRRIEDDRRR